MERSGIRERPGFRFASSGLRIRQRLVLEDLFGREVREAQSIRHGRVRSDGRRELELRGTIETDDGSRIAFAAEGVGSPRVGEPIVDLAVKIDLLTAAPAYSWVNAKLAWGSGSADLAANKIHVEVYLR